MTTAHRATFKPAVGGSDQGGNRLMMPSRQFSSKDMAGHTILKERGIEQVGGFYKGKQVRNLSNGLQVQTGRE